VSSDQVLEALATILVDANHPAFIRALRWATEQGYGKVGTEPLYPRDAESEPRVVVVRFANESSAGKALNDAPRHTAPTNDHSLVGSHATRRLMPGNVARAE
jgi:hypothetical protein